MDQPKSKVEEKKKPEPPKKLEEKKEEPSVSHRKVQIKPKESEPANWATFSFNK